MSTTTTDLHPGSRLLRFVLEELADENGRVNVPSGELLKATGWTNRMTLRRHMHALEDLGVLEVVPTYREDGGRGPNIYRLKGDA